MEILQELLNNALGVAGALAAINLGLIELFKPILPVEKKYIPPISVIIALVFALVIGVLIDGNLVTYGLAGIIGGLSASGLYDNGKAIKK